MSQKDIHRYSHSRLSTFKQCPRKHHYIYVEQIEQPEENLYTTSGKLFHQAREYIMKGKDPKPIYKEWEKLCNSGKLELEPDLLEYIVPLYFQYYAKDFSMEKSLGIEEEFKDDLEGEDYIVGAIDEVFVSMYNYVRDIKTTLNTLKYTEEDVRLNQQLLLYIPYAEEKYNITIDGIQIDEVRLAKLQPVPITSRGKPTTDKRQLSLVTYEDYYNELCMRGLDKEKEFQPILEELRKRGHPLFNRVTVQVLDRNVISTNAQDILDTYHIAKQDASYKVKGPLCKFCAYKELCELDATVPDTQSREALIEKIKNS